MDLQLDRHIDTVTSLEKYFKGLKELLMLIWAAIAIKLVFFFIGLPLDIEALLDCVYAFVFFGRIISLKEIWFGESLIVGARALVLMVCVSVGLVAFYIAELLLRIPALAWAFEVFLVAATAMYVFRGMRIRVSHLYFPQLQISDEVVGSLRQQGACLHDGIITMPRHKKAVIKVYSLVLSKQPVVMFSIGDISYLYQQGAKMTMWVKHN